MNEKNNTKSIKMLTVQEFFDKLERFAGHAVYRSINVGIDKITKKKYSYDERNNWDTEKVSKDRGDLLSKTFSLYLKHIPKLYVIDIDTKNIENLALKSLLDSKKNVFSETKKGYHYYVFINNMIEYTNQTKVYFDETYEVDLIRKNNVWETKTRKIYGDIENINSFDWKEDLECFFNVEKMNPKRNNILISLTPPLEDKREDKREVVEKDTNKIRQCVMGLKKERANDYSMWLELGIALYDQGKGGNHNLDIWSEFCQKNTRDGSTKKNVSRIYEKWRSFNPRESGLTINSIFHWLKEDNYEEFKRLCVPQNKYAGWFAKGPSFFIEKMNEELIYHKVMDRYFYKNGKGYIIGKYKACETYYSKFKFKSKTKDEKEIQINPFTFWVSNIDRRDISEIVLKPNQEVDKDTLNKWKGFNIEKTGESDTSKIEHFLNHIKHIWASDNEQRYEYLLNWFAQVIQKPEKKTKMCVVLQSDPGVGKSCVLDLIGEIIGKDHYLMTYRMEDVLGKFNNLSEDKILINFNETNYGGDKKIIGAFKSLITDNSMRIEHKGHGSYNTTNLINCIITTNEEWVVPVDSKDRRFYLIECNNKFYDKEYYKKIIETDLQELANFFYNRNIENFDATKIEFTELMKDQIIRNLDSVESFIHNISEGDIDISYLRSENDKYDETKPITIKKEAFYDLYTEKNKGYYNKTVARNIFWKKVKKVLPSIQLIKSDKYGGPRMKILSMIKIQEEVENYTTKK